MTINAFLSDIEFLLAMDEETKAGMPWIKPEDYLRLLRLGQYKNVPNSDSLPQTLVMFRMDLVRIIKRARKQVCHQ